MSTQKTAAEITAESVTVYKQSKVYGPRFFRADGDQYRITSTVRYDDRCKNGHNTFSITGQIDIRTGRGTWVDCRGGCIHEEIAAHFPELAPFIKWHLTSSTEPMHYIANTVYHAGDRDCHGLRKGEKRQIKNGRTGLPAWELSTPDGRAASVDGVQRYVDSETQPVSPVAGLVYAPWCQIGEGKERDLDAARGAAVWPDATDAQLSEEPEILKAALLARLPALLCEFRTAVESLGFTW